MVLSISVLQIVGFALRSETNNLQHKEEKYRIGRPPYRIYMILHRVVIRSGTFPFNVAAAGYKPSSSCDRTATHTAAPRSGRVGRRGGPARSQRTARSPSPRQPPARLMLA